MDTAASVNKILNIDYETPSKRYAVIRDSLIKAVKAIHPNFAEINSDWIERVYQEFRKYKAIFTTNYDLLIYWIAATHHFKNFTDYFWSSNLTFDQFNTEIYDSKIPLLYLHGSLCLYKEMNRVKKIKRMQDTDSYSKLITFY